MTWFGLVVVALLALKWLGQLWLEWLNAREVRRHSHAMPESLKSIVEPATFARSAEYTLAKSRLREIELTYSTLVLLVVLFSGILPWTFGVVRAGLGRSTWALAVVLLLTGVGLSLLDLPFDWYSQFRLEQRFGFNTTTRKLWWADRLKGFCLAAILGYPLLVVILFLIQTAGHWWWLWAWAVLMGFQLLVGCARSSCHFAAVQQVYTFAGGHLARPVDLSRATHALQSKKHPAHGRKQTVAALQCLFHRFRELS